MGCMITQEDLEEPFPKHGLIISSSLSSWASQKQHLSRADPQLANYLLPCQRCVQSLYHSDGDLLMSMLLVKGLFMYCIK